MTEHKVTMESTLKVLLEQKKYSTLKDILVTMNPSDVAELFGEIADERLPRLFRLLPKELAAETFIEMQPEEQELLIRGFSDAELRAVVEELYVDDAVDLALYMKKTGFVPDQVQDFYPTPGTLSTCIYYTEKDPFTGRDVYVAKDPEEKKLQRALLHFNKKKNEKLVRRALGLAGRKDLEKVLLGGRRQ